MPHATLPARDLIATESVLAMEQDMARLRVQRGLRRKVPHAADILFELGDRVLVWREKLKSDRILERTGPFAVIAKDRDKFLAYFCADGSNGPPKPFGLAQVKPYKIPEDSSEELLIDLHRSLYVYKTPAVQPRDKDNFLTEVLDLNYPRC